MLENRQRGKNALGYRKGSDYNVLTGLYPQSVAVDRNLQEVADILEKCSMDSEFGEYFIRCEVCTEQARCVRLWLYMVEQTTNHGIRYVKEPDFDKFLLNFTLIQERLNNGHNGDGRLKWVKSDQLYSPQNQ